ncbi:cytochrome c biogenesis heme-transporting ATPase CcmA [Alkalimarinus alittae]|uniref:Cytochrome c biogenesis heme-transporting ATPase CcmA n=1 Tax=Alkalimarinus alittae TaxID=2961619 RepID=A0ABY6MYL3_9ALTE|nr:cytochrome c biogenesis heme-transporting ATPase CcmA [Alkalimarinus alittae]UZE94925.1 cytochrome c biogenesis heme-transporting ATPase CcmA [Alkalimarinus alittae]
MSAVPPTVIDTSTSELLRAESLFCERDERVLFEDLNFSINAGEIIQVEGPNGSGKTTLLRIMSGLSGAYEGAIFWKGEPVNASRIDFLSNLLYLGHKPGVKAILTPVENLRALMGVRQHVSDDQIHYALEKVGLYGYEDVPCHNLSAGQHRRVALARLYLSTDALWILDEAFTAIDKKGVKELETLLQTRAQQGGAVLLTTHHELQLESGFKKLQLGKPAGACTLMAGTSVTGTSIVGGAEI